MASVGAGGFEWLPYYQLGGHSKSEYSYGSNASRELFRAAMETAEEEGLLVDFAVAANQGQGVPAEPGTPGLAVHLVSFLLVLTSYGRRLNVLGLLQRDGDARPDLQRHSAAFFPAGYWGAILHARVGRVRRARTRRSTCCGNCTR